MDQRQRLLQANQRLDNSTKRLEESHRVAVETEAIGAGILKDLHGQREKIVKVQKNVSY
jgi:vesicle transport through interaction with t-SNAREs protein 1